MNSAYEKLLLGEDNMIAWNPEFLPLCRPTMKSITSSGGDADPARPGLLLKMGLINKNMEDGCIGHCNTVKK